MPKPKKRINKKKAARGVADAKREAAKPRVAKSAREDFSQAAFRVVKEATEPN